MGSRRNVAVLVAAACLGWAGSSSPSLPVAAAKGGAKTGPAASDEAKQINDVVELAGAWIYDDIDKGFEVAKKEGKPLCFVFR